MKAIILAGGEGTRLRPLTYDIPKALVEINNKTLTEHVIALLKNININDIILSVSYKSDLIKDYFKDGAGHGINVSYLEEKERLGTLGPLLLLKEDRIKETFMVLNGDNLFKTDLIKMLEFHKKQKALGTIALSYVDDPSSYGVAKLKGSKIVEFVEKPKDNFPSHWINGGYYFFEPEVFDLIKNLDRGMIETFLFPKLAEMNRLYGFKDKSLWFDTGTFERLEKVRKNWK